MQANRADLIRSYRELKHPIIGCGKELDSSEAASFGQVIANTSQLNASRLDAHLQGLGHDLASKTLDRMRSKLGSHTTWRSLILPGGQTNGSFTKLITFLTSQTISENPLVAALAHERIFVANEILHRFMNNKSNIFFGNASPTVLWHIYSTFKGMSNNIKSPRAADLARDKFFDEFYSSIVSYAV